MTDTKLRPEDLTSEEWALFHQAAIALLSSGNYEVRGAQMDAMEYVKSSRALFSPAPSEAKVECAICQQPDYGDHDCPEMPEPAARVVYVCPNCNKQTVKAHEHEAADSCMVDGLKWTCQPAPPEPAAPVEQPTGYTRDGAFDVVARVCKFLLIHEADLGAFPTAHELKEAVDCIVSTDRDMVAQSASRSPAVPEMPEAVREAVDQLRLAAEAEKNNGHAVADYRFAAANALESWWRNSAQPVGMTGELETVLDYLEEHCDNIEGAIYSYDNAKSEAHHARACIAAVPKEGR